jgi:predicted DNA-binding transcriptional regulator YafY
LRGGQAALRRPRVRRAPSREVVTGQRNKEFIRQWRVLRAIESAADMTVQKLAAANKVGVRTIRRDLVALQDAGFPLYTEQPPAGPHYWRLSRPLGKLNDTTFSLAELCAFYANRRSLAAGGGTLIDDDLDSAMKKIGRALTPRMKKYLDELSAVLTSKPEAAPKPRGDGRGPAVFVETLAAAAVEHHRIEMDYHSFHSRRVKKYIVEPHRLTFTNGGLYLYAFVPAYAQMRTFALQRVRKLKVLDERFTPGQVPEAPYENSLGPFSGGRTEAVQVEFLPSIAPYIEERVWHPSQQVTRREDGSVVLHLQVAVDPALRCWVLGFGHHARVLTPSALAADILEELEEAREQYVPPIPFDQEPAAPERPSLPVLPFTAPSSRPAAKSGTAARRNTL